MLLHTDPGGRRADMVARQIEARGIQDERLIGALRRVPRERFVPEALEEFAYDDGPLPIAESQTISQPYIVALMTQALELGPRDRVLEIGTGSGYSAAVLAETASRVYTIERYRTLADQARSRLEALGCDNVEVRCGDGTCGWPEQAPFDAIVVTAGGPDVPETLREQLAVGGRLVIPVGHAKTLQRLLRIRRSDETHYEREDLGPVRFVPLIGEQGWHDGGGNAGVDPPSRTSTPAEIVSVAAEPFEQYEQADLRPLLARIGGARLILLGEASHGTAEFYAMRARITRHLVAEAGVTIVAVEADWPDARQIDRFVHGLTPDSHPERAFTRFPTWMWANREVLDFARWLKEWNGAERDPGQRTGFYGLDLYSLYTSIRAVLAYLEDMDREAAAVARARYGCFEPWQDDPAAYGAAALRGRFEGCANEVVRMLQSLLERRLEYEPRGADRFFDAARNAAVVQGAERYYRAMYYGPHFSWNLRDQHMFETLQALLQHRGAQGRAVVWAHNSHLGNAAATAMSARGETNLGELCREAYGADCYAVGFGTHRGTVAAADYWDGPMRVMDVRPSREDSYEHVCHCAGLANFLLPLRKPRHPKLRKTLTSERLERAIGVIYRPETELASHYSRASLPGQFDEWIWFDESRAVEALPVESDPSKLPETFPFGL
ncbi:MAG TPA: protein-L-isoaspartate(D-aspartate) O-methyltransferase [Gammaproteobacteria bacterium]|nr:protein-L-isoaspartate(D-aspartate) O-methyltransferase [Gammaproteobacteria bacterium]